MSCKCQGCGNQYRIDVGVPDEVWERIKPAGKVDGAGLLCGSCIMARLEAMGVYGSYELVESGSYIPQQGQPETEPFEIGEVHCALGGGQAVENHSGSKPSLSELDEDYS